MPISGPLAASLQALLQKLQTDQAELDFQEEARRRLFASQQTQLDQAKPLALKSANQGLADRGMVQSGIGLGAHGNINTAYLTDSSNLGQGLQDDVGKLAKQRLSNQATYNWNFSDLLTQNANAEAAKASQGLLAPSATTPTGNPVVAVNGAPANPVTGVVSTKKPVRQPVVPKKTVSPIINPKMPVAKKIPVKKMPVIKSAPRSAGAF